MLFNNHLSFAKKVLLRLSSESVWMWVWCLRGSLSLCFTTLYSTVSWISEWNILNWLELPLNYDQRATLFLTTNCCVSGRVLFLFCGGDLSLFQTSSRQLVFIQSFSGLGYSVIYSVCWEMNCVYICCVFMYEELSTPEASLLRERLFGRFRFFAVAT